MLIKFFDNFLFYLIFIKLEYIIIIVNVEICLLDIEFCIFYFIFGIVV